MKMVNDDTSYAYDTANHLTRFTDTDSGNTDYLYDNSGNRTRVTEADSSCVNYAYDSNYRLTAETRSGTNSYDISYAYDDLGNRTQMVKDSTTSTYNYNSLNQLTSRTTSGTTTNYTYSTNGNLIREEEGSDTKVYYYTFDNKLAKIDLADGDKVYYVYDGQGNRRAEATDSDFTYHYTDPVSSIPNIIADADASFVLTKRYEYGLDLERMEAIGTDTYYYHNDGIGSTRAMTDADETITDAYIYDAFGNLVASSGSSGNEYKFTGERWDSSAGLLYLRARYYDPEVGRFTGRDPIGTRVGINLYAYARNNPVNLLDPKGLSAVVIDPGGGGGRPTGGIGPDPCPNYRPCPRPSPADPQTPGCDPLNNWHIPTPDCMTKCCNDHDRCYAIHNCHAWSVWMPWCASPACIGCNIGVVGCFIRECTPRLHTPLLFPL